MGPSTCQSGYFGAHCNTRCPNGTFGVSCGGKCWPMCPSEICHHIYGCLQRTTDIIQLVSTGKNLFFQLCYMYFLHCTLKLHGYLVIFFFLLSLKEKILFTQAQKQKVIRLLWDRLFNTPTLNLPQKNLLETRIGTHLIWLLVLGFVF